MNAGSLISLWRSDVTDTERPYLWSEEESFQYANEAYTTFVRLTGGVPDASSAVTSVPVVTGQAFSNLDPSVYKIKRAWRADGKELDIISNTDVPLVRTAGGGVKLLALDATVGPIEYAVMGVERLKIRWYPIPTTNETVKLSVHRLPLNKITTDADEFSDINEEYHRSLLLWMKALCYRKQDAETFDAAKAAEHEAMFYTLCDQVAYEMGNLRRKAYSGVRAAADRSEVEATLASTALGRRRTLGGPTQ